MTTSESPAAAGSELSPQAMPDGQALELQVERTREQLGETVQELVYRVDVKSRAQAKASELSGKVKSTTARTRDTVWDARADWMPLAAAAGVLIVGFWALRQWSRR
jgi:hypothetical protein